MREVDPSRVSSRSSPQYRRPSPAVAAHVMNRPAMLFVSVTVALCADQALLNPYRMVERWLHIPAGRAWGQTPGVDIGPDGAIWVLERCGGVTCAGRTESPIFEFDRDGRMRKNFGARLFVHPHGFFVD